MEREGDTVVGLNQLLDENREQVGVASSPTCLYLLHLVDFRPGISLEDLGREYTFKSGTAESWMQRLIDVGLIERDDASGYRLTKLGMVKADFAETKGHLCDLVDSHPGITAEDIAREHSFRVGTAETWMKAFVDDGVIEYEGAGYRLTEAGERQVAIGKMLSDKPKE